MKPLTSGRAAVLALVATAILSLGVSADRAFVTNRGGTTVSIFDTTTNTEDPSSPVTVGSGPIDIAADRPATTAPQKLFVANSGSSTVSVVWGNPAGVVATISSDSFFGSLATPSGVALADDGVIGPTMAVVDQKSTSYIFGGSTLTGRSTIRFIDPVSNAVVDAFQEPSATSRYTSVVYTSSGGARRFWIGDGGDGGVTVLKLDAASGPPFYFNRVITYQGAGEFADFVADTSASPTFLKSPVRLATNGTNRVVVADGASKVVTILDATYVSTNVLGEPGAILANVDLGAVVGAAPAFTCASVAVAGNFAYITTTNAAGAGWNCYQIDLTTLAVTDQVGLGGAFGVAGVGATSDAKSLYVGEAAGGGNGLFMLDIDPPTDFSVVAPVAVAAFTSAATPFAFSSSATVGGGPAPGPGPIWSSTSSGTSSSHSGCGLMGIEALAALLLLRRLRRA